MHRTIRPSHVATTVAGAALLAGIAGATAPATADDTRPDSTRERGYVLECQGIPLGHDHDHREARVTLYENNRHGNELVVTLDDTARRTAIAHPDDLIVKGDVRSTVRIRGQRALVVGDLGRDSAVLRCTRSTTTVVSSSPWTAPTARSGPTWGCSTAR